MAREHFGELSPVFFLYLQAQIPFYATHLAVFVLQASGGLRSQLTISEPLLMPYTAECQLGELVH